FAPASRLGGGETAWVTSDPDKVRSNPTTLTLSSPNPVTDGLEKTVSWDIQVKNTATNADAAYAWVHFQMPSGEVDLLHVIDVAANDTLDISGDIFRLGSILRNTSRNVRVVARYHACQPDFLLAFSGYQCTGYPATFADFTCQYTSLGLFVEPKEGEMQALLDGVTMQGACANPVQLTAEISSVQFAVVDSIVVKVRPVGANGASLAYVAGSTSLRYPMSGAFVPKANPQIQNGVLTFTLSALDAGLASRGLPGVTDLTRNTLQLRWDMNTLGNYVPGDYVEVSISAQAPCGQELPSIVLNYDPSVRFSRSTTSGLGNDNGNNWSVSWVDYNNDGFEDVFVPDYDPNANNLLYRNNGNNTFTRITTGPLVTDRASSIASVWGDIDNDGDEDAFLANNIGAPNRLYINDGSGSFTRNETDTVAKYAGYSHSASFADYDNDGWLDLFVGDYMPTKFNLLYHNNGDGSFSEVRITPISDLAAYTIGNSWADYDNDGDADLFVTNDRLERNRLYRNEGNARFTEIFEGPVVNDRASSVGSSWGDYDNDGDLDLFVANSNGQGNFLYDNNGDGSFTPVNAGPLVTDTYHSHGSAWADVDNDGDLDIFVTNDQSEPNRLYLNGGDKTFSVTESPLNRDSDNSFGTAFADPDNDGDLDVYVANHSGEADAFYVNGSGSCKSWACFRLTGTRSNRSAIGAKVRVKSTIYGRSVWQMREISSQSGGGAGGQSTRRAMFGLGDASSIDSVIVEWPSGMKQYLTSQTVSTCFDLTEPAGNRVCGRVYYDKNLNCVQDADEAGVPETILRVMPGSRYISTNSLGDYQAYLEDGTYTLTVVSRSGWSVSCPGAPASYTVTLAGSTACGRDFALTPACNLPDMHLLMATTALRQGYRNTFSVTTENLGAGEAQNLMLALDFDSRISLLEATTTWDSVAVKGARTVYYWKMSEVPPFGRQTLRITDSVSVAAPIGEEVLLRGYFTGLLADCNNANDTTEVAERIVGAVDPNDKLVFPEGLGTEGYIFSSDTLTYRIRFQNVGTTFASRVLVTDTLSPDLDISTLELGQTSHDCEISVSEDGVISWTFYHINLPDSLTNELASHGFVQFRIAPLPGLAHGTPLENTAYIQFDYGAGLLTNTVRNTFARAELMDKEEPRLYLYPNPMSDLVRVQVLLPETDRREIYLRRIDILHADGRIAATFDNLNELSPRIARGDLAAGLYVVRAYDTDGFEYQAKLSIY
ncbi:MAG: hypothetical protein EAZ89_11155, partial [Bacteroidetes bacterium]